MALTNEVLKSFKERFNSCKTNKVVAASVSKVMKSIRDTIFNFPILQKKVK